MTNGTVFEASHLKLSTWPMAIHLMSSSKKGMSAHQLHRMLGITYRAAWFAFHRLREAMAVNGSVVANASDRRHETVNHSSKEYVRGNAHTNTVKGFFSLLKRGINSETGENRPKTEGCPKGLITKRNSLKGVPHAGNAPPR